MAAPTFEHLQTRLTALASAAVTFEGVVYRACTPKYATESDLLTGEGSRLRGGRWNPIGTALVYSTLTPEAAMAEALAHYRYSGLPIEDSMPLTFAAVNVKLKRVLDTRDGKVRQRFQIPMARLVLADWRLEVFAGREPLTQTIGRAVHATGWEGVIVPSAADRSGHNLLIFPDRLEGDSRITIVNSDKLSRS